MKARRRAIGTAAVATTAVLLAGCGSSGGSSSGSPRSELSSASHALGDASSLTMTLRLATTPTQLQQLSGHGSDHIGRPAATAIAQGSIVVQALAPSGKQLSDVHSISDLGAASLTLNSEGHALASLRDVGKTLYLQVDLKDLLGLARNSSEYAKLRRQVAHAPAFVQDVIAGKWVSVQLSTLESFSKFVEGTLAGIGSAPPTPSSSQTQRLINALRGVLSKDVTVTRSSSGGSDHLTITGNIRTVGRDLLQAFSSSLPTILSQLGSSTNPDSLPNRTVSVDAFVTGGVLSRLSLNLAQFAPPSARASSLPLVASFTRNTGSVVAPAGATSISEADIGQFFSAIGSGGFGK